MNNNYIGYKLLSNFSKVSSTKVDIITLPKTNFAVFSNKYIAFIIAYIFVYKNTIMPLKTKGY